VDGGELPAGEAVVEAVPKRRRCGVEARHLSRILCLRGSLLALETRLKDGVELVESVLDGGSDTAPASGFQWRDGETELELEGLLRLERTSMIAAHDFELAVNGLDEVGRGERAANWVGVIQEGEVVIPFFADFAHEERGARLKMLAQVLERGGSDRGVPGRLQGADTRMEFGGLGFAQGTLGIALQMNDAEKEWKTQEASFPLFPPRLEIRPTTPDSHIPTTPAAMIISRHNFQATPHDTLARLGEEEAIWAGCGEAGRLSPAGSGGVRIG
jgi:hypothetical protein